MSESKTHGIHLPDTITGYPNQPEHDQQIAPIEAHTAVGPSMIQEAIHHDESYGRHYIFKRLRRDLPLPSKRRAAGMVFGLFMVMFLAGWNDASQGPLLPALQEYYNVDYLVISVIWICNFVGFMIAGSTNVFITDRVGLGIATPFGASMQGIGYVLACWGPPFPLFVIAYIFNGFGLGLLDAQANSLVTRLPGANTKMFLMHAIYGFGATVSPLVATEFVKRERDRVYLYFLVSLGLAFVCVTTLIVVFQFRTDDQVVGRRDPSASEDFVPHGERSSSEGEKDMRLDSLPTTDERTGIIDSQAGEPVVSEKRQDEVGGSGNKMKRILKIPTVHFMAFYIAIYVGVEVTIGGWATSYLIAERGGDDNAGYVTTGYFAGITIGRVILIPVTKWLGQYNSVYIYSALAIALEIMVWTIPNLVANGVCFSLCGIFLGPLYPIVMMVVIEVIPPELQGGSIGWIASLGQAGSAMMPFITGGISNHYGPWILQPLVIAFIGLSVILWTFVPRPKNKGWRV